MTALSPHISGTTAPQTVRRRNARPAQAGNLMYATFPATPVRHHPHPSQHAGISGATQALLGATAQSEQRGSLLLPLGISFVAGTVGWLLGGFWWSMAAGAAGYAAGEALR